MPVSKDDLTHAEVGIVHATEMEISPLLSRCDRVSKYTGGDLVVRGGKFDKTRVAFVQSGMGPARAAKATQALIDAHSPEWILSAGYSGALRPELKRNDIVVADSIVDAAGVPLTIDLKMPADPARGLHVGRLFTSDTMVRTVAEKQALGEKYQALAVDMESIAVARKCQQFKTRFLAIRVISDDMTADLPPEILTVVGSTGAVRLGAAVSALWNRPGSITDMWKLRTDAMGAADKLATFLEGVIDQLHRAG